MAPNPIKCSKTGCEFTTPATCPDWDKMLRVLELHTAAEHGTVQAGPATERSGAAPRLEKLPRPTFSLEMTQNEWAFKESQWRAYISQSVVPDKVKVQQLQAACDELLLRRVYDAGGLDSLNTEELLISQIKKLAVRVVHKTLHLQNMWSMTQSPDESVRAFCSRLVGTADLCDLVVVCSKQGCGEKTSYRDHVVLQALLRGMHDADIRTRVLSRTQNNELEKLSDVVDYIAAEEASSQSFSSLNSPHTIAAAKSSYKQLHTGKGQTPDPPRQDKCRYCGGRHPGDRSLNSRKEHCKAFDKTCSKCEKLHHFSSVCRSTAKAAAAAVKTDSTESVTGAMVSDAAVSSFYAMQSVAPTNHTHLSSYAAALKQAGPVTTIPLPHCVHSLHAGWLLTPARPSPTHPLEIKVDRAAYASLHLSVPKSSLKPSRIKSQQSCLDTGAQLTTVPVSILSALNIKVENLLPVATNLNTVTGMPVDIIGGIFLTFTGTNPTTGGVRITRQLAYVSRSVPYPFMSREACTDLGVIPLSFPAIGSCDAPPATAAATSATHTPCTNTGVSSPGDAPCSCPLRQPPPTTPPVLPCSPTKENLPQLKQYIMDRYAASAFNTCEHQVLPLMQDSPPLRLFADEEATPVAFHSPAAVPVHWNEQVKAGLDRDVRLGVIERVAVNDPVTWCSRMVITPKSDGSPRRVVDFQPVNAHCPRQTHHTRSRWHIASSVPHNTARTVLDAWHGYHSVPVHPADRHLTTFITPYGRYRYRTAPQGFLSAGDSYTQRSDEIIGDFPNHLKCVDDSILWGEDIASNFFSTCSFLDKCSAGGIIFNSSKFQFAEEEVRYLGFLIVKDGLKPTPEFLENIRSFPSPKSLTDIRSWYGAINQISYTFATSQAMLPFRQLLRPQIPFYWSEELQAAFIESKEEIIRQCEKGVRLFSLSLPTGLATDWSKSCMGWWLVQKHCQCPGSPVLGCCKTGWQTVYCGSKFNTTAESRVPPIEGEALAATHGLEKCSHFILGHPNLLLALDHKPLIKIFGDAKLESITNPRLFSLKMKTLKFRYTPVHVAGKKHVVPDAFSRRGDDEAVSNVLPGYANTMGPPDWVSSPTLGQIRIADNQFNSDHAHVDTEAFVTGLAMSKLEEFNNPPETLLAGVVTAPLQAITWEMLMSACRTCPEYQLLHNLIEKGAPEDSKSWDQQLLPYHRHRHLLTTVGPVVLINDRPVVPKALRPRAIDHCHAGHPGLATMCLRLSNTLYWPNYKEDFIRSKLSCTTCRASAPSNPAMPPNLPVAPQYPFQSIVCDFFTVSGQTYAAMADRYSNWLSILQLKRDTSQELVTALRNYFSVFGIAELLSSDGASIFTSSTFTEFCRRWGVAQRISSAYFPRSNKRAEVAVKQAKRLVSDSLGPGGSLDTDALARALLAHRNTQDPLTGLSPAQVVFGRRLRDFLPCSPGQYEPRPEWRLTADRRELAHAKRHIKTEEALHRGSKQLLPLIEGDLVSVQDQNGNTPRRWSKTGKILESLGHDSYLIKVDGSNRITKRNRQFLRRIEPFVADTDLPATPSGPPVSTPLPAFTGGDPISEPALPDSNVVDPVDILVAEDDHPEPDLAADPPLPGPSQPANTVTPVPVSQAPPVGYHHDMGHSVGPHPGGQVHTNQPIFPSRGPHIVRVLPPAPPGMPHYDVLRRMEIEARQQAEASKQLSAYLASIMANTAVYSSWVGGINGYQFPP